VAALAGEVELACGIAVEIDV